MMRFFFAISLGLATTVAHAQFEMQDSTTTADLRGIVSVGNGVAWASGTHGTVLRTEDGGFVWQGCTTPPGAEKLDFRGIQAFDDQTAIVMSSGKGDLSRVYRTTDGCVTWKLVFTNPDADGFFDGISMHVPSVRTATLPNRYRRASGYLLGDPVGGNFAVFSTLDGGDTWIRRGSVNQGSELCRIDAFEASSGEAAFAASNQSLLVGFSLPLFVTGGTHARFRYVEQPEGNGSRCHQYTVPLGLSLANGPSSGAFAVAVKDTTEAAKHLIVVGGDYARPGLSAGTAVLIDFNEGSQARTERYRQQASQTPPHGYRSSVAYDSKANTWITVGTNGTDISLDDGRNWQLLRPGKNDKPDADRNWNALSLPFVVGPHGRIGRLRDDALKMGK